MAAVLFSDLVGLNEDELLSVSNRNGNYLYDSIESYSENKNQKDALSIKLNIFLDKYNKLVKKKDILIGTELIEEIYKEFVIIPYFRSLSRGETRVANLEYLISLSKTYQNSGDFTIDGFINYIKDVKQRKLDFGEKNIAKVKIL